MKLYVILRPSLLRGSHGIMELWNVGGEIGKIPLNLKQNLQTHYSITPLLHHSNCDLPASASRSGEAGGAKRTKLSIILAN